MISFLSGKASTSDIEQAYECGGIDYVVKPFKVSFDPHTTDDSKLSINLSSGLAYINGYRVYIPSDIKIETPKSQTIETKNNEVVAANYGNYIIVDTLKGIENNASLKQKWKYLFL